MPPTELGTELGTTLGTHLGAMDDEGAPSIDQTITALSPFAWLRADSYNVSSGKVTAFVDKAQPGHVMQQSTPANQVATPAPNAALNGQLSAAFVTASATNYTSSLPASAWTFLHDGSGATVIFLWVPNTATQFQTCWATLAGTTTPGAMLENVSNASNGIGHFVGGSGVVAVNRSTAGSFTVGAATYFETSLSAAAWRTAQKGTQTGTGAPGTLSSAAPANTLALGRRANGTEAASIGFGDLLIFNRVLTAPERATFAAYALARYGIS